MAQGRHAFRIDRITCDGYGMCAELVPELIALDDWGYPIVAPWPIPPHLLGHARRAVEVCPVLAIRLVAEADPPRPHRPGRDPAGARAGRN